MTPPARTRPVDSAPAHELVGDTPSPAARAAEEQHLETYGRAGFLTLATIGLGGVIGAGVMLPSLGFAVLPSFTGEGVETNDVDLGPISNFPEGTFVITTFTGNKRQGEVSRAHGLHPEQRADRRQGAELHDHLQPLRPPRLPGAAERARSSRRRRGTYKDVTLTPVQPAGFGCPCHGGAYDTEGNRTAGPPVRSLDRYAFSIVNGNLVLGKHFSVGTVEGTGADAQDQPLPPGVPGRARRRHRALALSHTGAGVLSHGQVRPPGTDREGRSLPARLGRGAHRPRRRRSSASCSGTSLATSTGCRRSAPRR